jgi:thiamine pyrophosphate-dependent acetolactate synthase large subunit-like protein
MSIYGTPGPVYVEITQDVLYGKVDEASIDYLPKVEPLPHLELPDVTVKQVIALLKSAK